MTCIVGYNDDGNCYIGADSAASNGYDIDIRKDEKVFVKDNFIFGFSWSYRFGQIIKYSFKTPEHKKELSDDEYLHTVWLDALRDSLKSGGYIKEKDKEEVGGQLIFRYNKKLYFLDTDFQIGEYIDSYCSTGSGSKIALGALYAIEELCPWTTEGMAPWEKVHLALTAATRYNSGVRPPFVIYCLDEKNCCTKYVYPTVDKKWEYFDFSNTK